MSNIYKTVLLCFILVLQGCAASGPLFQEAPQPEASKALIYIYRPGGFTLGGRDAYFYLNDKNIADLSSEGYTQVYVDPGSYVVKQKWPIDLIGFKNLELPLTVEANNTYYYRFATDNAYSNTSEQKSCPVGNICFAYSLTQVTEQAAKLEILKCHFQPAKNK